MRKCKTIIRQLFFLAFLIGASSNFLFAQERDLIGKVTEADTGEPVPGANISIKGTTNGTITDLDGKFTIQVKEGQSLIVSFIGMETQEILIKDQTSLDVKLLTEATDLETIVVVGYGTQKKKEVTGAVSSVKTDDMLGIAASDFSKTLQGKVAGVNISQSSGRPGEEANVQIRGLGSITGSNTPLYVIDGIPYNSNEYVLDRGQRYNNTPSIPAEEIESVEILKDGASTAIYGTRAANGVILITTKRGKAGKTKVGFSSYYGVQNITSGTPLLNTKEHIYVDEITRLNSGVHSPILDWNPDAMDYDTDFVGSIANNNAPLQNYNLSISTGAKNMSFNFNTNYFKQDGIIINSGYERLTSRLNATFSQGKFDAFVSLGIATSTQEAEAWGLYEYAVFQGPYRRPISEYPGSANSVTIDGNNPDHVGFFAQLLNQDDTRKDNSFNIATNLKYEIIDGLTFQVNLGLNQGKFSRDFWRPQYLVFDRNGAPVSIPFSSRPLATLEQSHQDSRKLTMENVLNYSKTFGKHSVSVLAGYTIEKMNYNNVGIVKEDFIDNSVSVFDGGASAVSISGYENVSALTGKLFRAQYSYDGKYMISASVRHDGSSKFNEDNRYATFPGVSVGWNISEENFMKSLDFIDNLKLRASYGEVGSEGIPNYLYATYVDGNIDYIWGREADDELGAGAIQRGYATSTITWETNISQNIGLDLTLLGGQVGLNVDVYRNSKENMLLNVLLPASTGTSAPMADQISTEYNTKTNNIGNMINQGIEVASFYSHKTKFGLEWKINATFTKNMNEITDLGGNEYVENPTSKPNQTRQGFQQSTTFMLLNHEAGSFYMIPTDGIINTQEELDEVRAYMPDAELGDVKYIDQINVDTDGDGIADATDGQINVNDRVYSGSGMPDFELGLGISAAFKGFDFSTQMVYWYGNKVYNGAKNYAYGVNRHKDLYYMWTPQNPTSNIPASRSGSEHMNWLAWSDYFLEDGSFLRIRNLTLGYTVPNKLFKDKIERLRFYVTAQNPFTFTNYEGYDPEVGGDGRATRGVDRGNYPVTRKFLIGVNFDF